MPQRRVTTARDRKKGMTVQEIRDALAGANSEAIPEASISMGGKIRAISVWTQP